MLSIFPSALAYLVWLSGCHAARDREQVAPEVLSNPAAESIESNMVHVQKLDPWQQAWIAEVFHKKQMLSLRETPGEAMAVSIAASKATSFTEVASNKDPWVRLKRKQYFLGEGGFGAVLLLKFDCAPEWSAAMKIQPKSIMTEREFQIHLHAMQQNGFVAGLYDTGADKPSMFTLADENLNPKAYSLMESALGGDLQHFMDQVWPTGLASVDNGKLAQVIYAQLSLAMRKLHDAGVVHRDLKPPNVLINNRICKDKDLVNTGESWIQHGCAVKIADFGLSCLEGKGCAKNARSGTPLYMAPEQWHGEESTAAVDMWAMGHILYFMLFHASPYGAIDGWIDPLYSQDPTVRYAKKALQQREFTLHMAPASWWTYLVRFSWWRKAEIVLKSTLRRDTGDSTKSRFTSRQNWESEYVKPMAAYAIEAEKVQQANRTPPQCVVKRGKSPLESFFSNLWG